MLALYLTKPVLHPPVTRADVRRPPASSLLWWVGLLCIGLPLLWPVIAPCRGLLHRPAARRKGFSVGIGVSSAAVARSQKGILLCAFSLLMRDAKTISDEHNCYV